MVYLQSCHIDHGDDFELLAFLISNNSGRKWCMQFFQEFVRPTVIKKKYFSNLPNTCLKLQIYIVY